MLWKKKGHVVIAHKIVLQYTLIIPFIVLNEVFEDRLGKSQTVARTGYGLKSITFLSVEKLEKLSAFK
jgi:hypothetical protein